MVPRRGQESQTRGQVRTAIERILSVIETVADATSVSINSDQQGDNMPLIQVKLIENVFTPEQKKQIISKLTDAMVSIEGENMRPVTFVTIEEVRSGEWGIGGKAMTTGAVQALAAGRAEPAPAGWQ
jgi:4-oxalocrotonate tautomerase